MLKGARIITVLSLSIACFSLNATNTLEQVIQEGSYRASDNARSQSKIDVIVDITEKDHEQYRQVSQSIKGLKTYNDLLQKQVDDQQIRLEDIHTSLDNSAQMHRDILPLVEEMVSNLSQFVALDLPFLKAERTHRIHQLQRLINQSNIDIAEKFRQVSDAYQVEMEYGRTIESYREILHIDGTERELTLLRIGRIALLYRSEDGQFLGGWNKVTQQWAGLEPSQYDRAIKNGIAMALKQKTPSLIITPIIVAKQPDAEGNK